MNREVVAGHLVYDASIHLWLEFEIEPIWVVDICCLLVMGKDSSYFCFVIKQVFIILDVLAMQIS